MPKIRIYTTHFCPFCHQAVALLQRKNVEFEQIAVDNNPELRQKLASENNGYRTVPMIFIGDEFIGGCSELQTLVANGEFDKKMQG